MKIALFGGSFDPIHTDHVNIIKACHDNLKFDEVWVIPAYVNPFKNLSTSSVAQRLKMLEIATKDLPYVKILKYEISKKQRSYTYETVKYFRSTYPEIDFSFIIGSDQLDSFESWNFFDELIKMIPFKVFLRSDKYREDVVKKHNLEVFTFENNYLSSTDIRNLHRVDLQIPEVNDFINENMMYLYERMETKMDEKRFFHSLNVGQMSLELAKLNGVNLDKALIAGTLHDIAKRWPEEEMKSYLEKYRPELLDEPKPVWHSFVGAMHIKYDWIFRDDEIISAIFKHTVGAAEMSTLDMIVFCADKISIERDYEGVEELRKLVRADLQLGFRELLKQQVEVASKKHGEENVGGQILKTYNHFVKPEEQ